MKPRTLEASNTQEGMSIKWSSSVHYKQVDLTLVGGTVVVRMIEVSDDNFSLPQGCAVSASGIAVCACVFINANPSHVSHAMHMQRY